MKLQSLNVRRVVATAAAVATVLGTAAALATPASADPATGCDATTCTTTFDYTGAIENFTVPDGVTSLVFAVSGAQGGAGYFGTGGGQGGVVGGALPVTPGQQLTVIVGQAGATGGDATFGGGGGNVNGGYTGTGGGGSFLFDASGTLLVAAGGGGGAGYPSSSTGREAVGGAGAGAGLTGGSGMGTDYYGPEALPTGGSSDTGGSGGSAYVYAGSAGSGPAAAGMPGQGGAGTVSGDLWGGGGGGGGYYGGGGGGYLQSGAGGSGYADPSVVDLSTSSGANSGNGVVSLGWDRQTPTVELSVQPTSSTLGDSVTLSATVSGAVDTPTGSVEFDVNASAIEGCSAQPITDGVATCTTTALPVGSPALQADYLGDTLYAPADSASTTYTVGPAAQTITFTSGVPTDAVVGDTYTPAATGGASGNDVTFTVDPSSTSVCSINGTTVTFDAAGTCVIDADQAGNTDYKPAQQAHLQISVATIDTTVTVTSSQTPSVFGQPMTVTASVTSDAGTPAGSVQFAVNGTDLGGPVNVNNGSARSPALTDAAGDALQPSAYTVSAAFTPTDPTVYGSSANSTTQVVNQAASSTALAVHPSSITATVAAVAPGTGEPSGSVTFSVAGSTVGTAPVIAGVATLAYVVPAGKTQQVAALYTGDDEFTGSSASTARLDPSITATVSSAHPKTKFGWYRTTVTVSFHCATHGADLTADCPKPVTLSRNGGAQSVTRTIAATNGGIATVTVRGINLDHTVPSVKVTGIRNGAVYSGTAPAAHCVGGDVLSGIASCALTRHTGGARTTYRATATDKAGNTRTVTGSYTVKTIYLQGAIYSGGAFTVKAGRTYTMVVLHTSRQPTYYDAAVYPKRPTRKDTAFHAAGHDRWALAITITRSLRSTRYWNLGVKIGSTLHEVKIRVTA